MVAYASLHSHKWVNDDGLAVQFPGDEQVVNRGGEIDFNGGHVTEVIVELTTLPAYGASVPQQILAENVTIPNGAFIEKVEVLVLEETAGTNANFNLGLIDQDRVTALDVDGFLAAADIFNAGTDLGLLTTYQVGTTEAGALIGTQLTNTGLIVGYADTADFTTGKLRCRIFWHVPLAADL